MMLMIWLSSLCFADLLAASQGRLGRGWTSDFHVPASCEQAIDLDLPERWSDCSNEIRSTVVPKELERDRLMWLVVSELRESDLSSAYRDFAPLLDFDAWQDDDWRVLILEAWLLGELNEGQKLKPLLADFPQEHHDYTGALIVQMNALERIGKVRQRDRMWHAISAHQMNPWLWWHRGQWSGDESPRISLRQAAQMQHAGIQHFRSYARYLLAVKEYDEAMKVILTGLSYHPDSISLSGLAMALSKESGMVDWLKEQSLVFPEHTKIQWVLGSVLLTSKEHHEAWQYFINSVRLGDDSVILRASLRKTYPNLSNNFDIRADLGLIANTWPESEFWRVQYETGQR